MTDKEKIKNDNLEEDLEIEFLEDDSKMEDFDNTSDEETIELEEISDGEDDLYGKEDGDIDGFDEDEIEYNPDEDYNSDEDKAKLSKEQIINRIIAGMGIAIAAFTIFYGVVAYGLLGKDDVAVNEPETGTATEQETQLTEENDFFISVNSDENISEEIKDLLENAELDEMKTGHSKVDDNVNNILKLTTKSEMNTYEKIRNIYDYMMYFYEVKSSSFVDEDTVYDFCSNYEYTSLFDMEIMYRANKLFESKSGDSKDYACGLTVLLRRLGLEAYYIEGKKQTELSYENQGYTLVIIDGKQYIFDVAEEDELSAGEKVEYKVFCKTTDELEDKYSDDGIDESITKFEEFKTLGAFSFNAKITTSAGDSASQSVGYNENNNSASVEDMTIDISDMVYFTGNVSGSNSNTWKLIAKVYDNNMNYITESTLYNSSNNKSSDEVSYRPARGGYVKLSYIVTDSNGRTCSVTVMLKVNGYEEIETTTSEPATTKPVASSGELR